MDQEGGFSLVYSIFKALVRSTYQTSFSKSVLSYVASWA